MATVELIDSATLGSAAATITFSSIPTTYKDLWVWASVRTTKPFRYMTWLTCRINGSTTESQYGWDSFSVETAENSSSVNTQHSANYSSSSNSYTRLGRAGGSTHSKFGTDHFGGYYIVFYDYANTEIDRPISSHAGGSGVYGSPMPAYASMDWGQYYHNGSGTEITSLAFSDLYEEADLAAGSKIDLYGVNAS